MVVYHVKTEGISLGTRIARTAYVVALAVLSILAVHYFWFSHEPNETKQGERLFDVALTGILFFAFESQRSEYDIEVDDETIRKRCGGLGLENCRVRRGRIRFLRESRGNVLREPGLRLSEHDRIGSFFSGYVWIPATLPEYEQIKATAMAWMKIA